MQRSSESEWTRLKLPATLESLEPFQDFIREQIQGCGCSQEKLFKLQLALEEALVNIMNYAYPKGVSGWIEVGACLEGRSQLWVDIRDGGRPFNPLERDKANIPVNLEQRQVGGLGIFLLRQMADHAEYRRENNENVLTLGFRLTSP